MILLFILCVCYSKAVFSSSDLTGADLDEFNGFDSSDAVLEYPYKVDSGNRVKRDCSHVAYGHLDSKTFPAHGTRGSSGKGSSDKLTLPIIESKQLTVNIGDRDVKIHIAYINNPVKTVSVYEPLHDGTCKPLNESFTVAKVQKTAESKHCLLATNAGLFNTHTGACYGL